MTTDPKAAFAVRATEIEQHLAQLQTAITERREDTEGRDVDWADVGDLAEIASQLENTVRFATGAAQ
jgi:hypothetical protein